MRKIMLLIAVAMSLASVSVLADTASAQKLADKYAVIAKTINPAATGLSVEDGKAFFSRELTIRGKQVACASCHTANPANSGKHVVTGKPIQPLAPAANPKRFSDLDKVEKNFEKHCLDIIGRDCTAQEKGNFIAYLISVK